MLHVHGVEADFQRHTLRAGLEHGRAAFHHARGEEFGAMLRRLRWRRDHGLRGLQRHGEGAAPVPDVLHGQVARGADVAVRPERLPRGDG